MKSLPTGTVTFLFTDIEGSTALLQRLGDARYADVLAEHRQLVRNAFAERQGHEVDTQGDAFLVAFSRARDAVSAAVAAQRALTSHAWPDGTSLRVRMGLHTGEPLSRSGDYVGLDVHRAARVAAAGHGGQVLVSDATHGLVAKDLPEGVELRDLGEHRLKDLAHPHRLFQVVTADLPRDFPELRSLNARPHNLPIQLTSFIGREKDIAEVKRLLGTARLVTLTGSGGAGKTRLAFQVAADVLVDYPDGAWLADMAPIAEPAFVPKTVASALNVPEQPGRDMTETLVDAVRPKAMLLVLDNCEHLLVACRDLTVALRRTCPQVRILATSREGLGVPGETLWRVPSLSTPEDILHLPPVEELALYDAVRLFADRASSTAPGFAVTRQNAPAVVQVCQRLDGIPLAIELAAARVKVLAVEQIAARLDDRFSLLTGGSRSVLPRQQTLRAAMDWSYDLLSAPEQVVLRRLSVFAGGWTLEAAEAVCAGGRVEASDVLDLLTHLVDKSLVAAETDSREARYRLLETVRQYGRDRLVESKESDEVLDHHLAFFLNLAEQAESHFERADQTVWFNRLEEEHDNFRRALAWSVQSAPVDGVRLGGLLGRFWMVRSHLTEGGKWFKKLLERSGDQSAPLRAKALNWAGWIATRQLDYAPARALHGESLTIYRELGDQRGVADSTWRLGIIAMNEADHGAAVAFLEETLSIFRRLGYEQGILEVLGDLGHEAWHQGHCSAARRLLEEAVSRARRSGQTRVLVFALYSLGLVAFDQHGYVEAHSHYTEGLTTARELGDMYYGVQIVEHFAALIAAEGQYIGAARLLAAADAFRKFEGIPLPFAHRLDYDRPLATIRAALSDDDFTAAWAEGRAMTLEQAIEYALAGE